MKKIVIVCALALLATGGLALQPAEAYTKKALGEMFTNTSCGPCKAANDQLDKWTDPSDPQYIPDWIVIRYHTSWPSASDPFYAANTGQNTARTNFYGVNSVPNMHFGSTDGGSNYPNWDNLALGEIGKTTPFDIKLYGSFDVNSGALEVQAHVYADSSVGVANNIFFVVTQDDVHWNAPNGQTVFFQAMVRMLNGTSGTNIPGMEAGEIQVYQSSYTLNPNWPNKPGISIDFNKANIVVFIQNMNNKNIRQVEASRLVDLDPPPTLWSNRWNFSAAVGADVDLHLEAGDGFGNRSYFMLGSVSGTSPGTPLGGGLILSLNWDVFTGLVFKLVNTPVFADFAGTLDGSGEGLGNFNSFGPVDPSFAGIPIYFAYTIYSPFDMVSDPVTVTVVP